MAAGPPSDSGFDALLLEGWERCADDQRLRASSAYNSVRRLLVELTSCGARGPDGLARLERALCAMRAGDYEGLRRQLERPDAVASDGRLRRQPQERHRREQQQQQEQQPQQQQQEQQPPQERHPQQQQQERHGPFPGPPESSADCALQAALAATDPCAGTPRFLRDVAAYTCDRGALLVRVTDAALSDFRAFADTALGTRVAGIGVTLAREQTDARARYGALSLRTATRAQLAVALVRDMMPAFDWRRYAAEPGYMRLVAVRPRPGCVARDDDADGADETRDAGLLYHLGWLRSEMDRVGASGRCVHAQHAELTAELAAVNRDVALEQRAAADRVACMSTELDGLRARTAEQVRAVDRLMAAVQTATQNSRAAEEGAAHVCAKTAAEDGAARVQCAKTAAAGDGDGEDYAAAAAAALH